ncbi:MAG: SMP-30/gluconolactonase/LRE family protein [Gemmataceae bacterium]|nr:SMP-30/gluconolactonase/LRE family protein [Gemmataceae bacterium]
MLVALVFSSILPPPCWHAPQPVGPMVRLHTGFVYTDGPVERDGNLYFTDNRAWPSRIYKRDPQGHVTLWLAPSGRANGLAFNSSGELVACQMDGRIVAYDAQSGMRVLASGYCGRRFNAPNDLVIDRQGGIYFTDPCFGAPLLKPQGRVAVYYLTPDGGVTRLIDNLANPNGITLSPDEKTLYVVPSFQNEVMAYPVLGPGELGPGRVFAHMARSWNLFYPGGDGIRLDVAGNLYIASQRGIQVFDPTGKLLRIVPVPERPSNLAFGGRHGNILYITARNSVYAVPWSLPGRESWHAASSINTRSPTRERGINGVSTLPKAWPTQVK